MDLISGLMKLKNHLQSYLRFIILKLPFPEKCYLVAISCCTSKPITSTRQESRLILTTSNMFYGFSNSQLSKVSAPFVLPVSGCESSS